MLVHTDQCLSIVHDPTRDINPLQRLIGLVLYLKENVRVGVAWGDDPHHNLRRTVATRMVDLGVLLHVVEAILNHVSGHKAGVAGAYNRALYRAEKRAALELWAEYLTNLVASVR